MAQFAYLADIMHVPSEYPAAIEPVYTMQEPNEPVVLYSGTLELSQEAQTTGGEGVVQFEWLPWPRFVFKVPEAGPFFPAIDKPVTMKLVSTGQSVAARLLSMSVKGTSPTVSLKGALSDAEFGPRGPMRRVMFHLPNFPEFSGRWVQSHEGTTADRSRAVLETDSWLVTIDAIDFSKRDPDGRRRWTDLPQQTRDVGGYLITHVGRIERKDGASFTAGDAKQLEESLSWFLSFVCARKVAPLLLVGFNESDERIWDEWRCLHFGRWGATWSWLCARTVKGLEGTFPGFMRLWNDPDRRGALWLAIHWYVEANGSAGGTGGSVVLAQAALEMLAYVILVEDWKVCSEAKLEKKNATNRLRQLLRQCGIPLDVPACLSGLRAFAEEHNCVDGPDALTKYRHALVHAKADGRRIVLGADSEANTQAWFLIIWYVELVLLRWFEYQGEYRNRLRRASSSKVDVELVPWAKKPDGS